MFQHHLQNNVSGVPAAVDYFFDQLEEVAQKNDLLRFVIALIKIAQQVELKFVGVAFD